MLQQIKLTLPAIIESKYSHYFFSYLSKTKLAEQEISKIAKDSSDEGLDLLLKCCLDVDPSNNLLLISETYKEMLILRFKDIETRGINTSDIMFKYNSVKNKILSKFVY